MSHDFVDVVDFFKEYVIVTIEFFCEDCELTVNDCVEDLGKDVEKDKQHDTTKVPCTDIDHRVHQHRVVSSLKVDVCKSFIIIKSIVLSHPAHSFVLVIIICGYPRPAKVHRCDPRPVRFQH